MRQNDLFSDQHSKIRIGEQSWLLKGFSLSDTDAILNALQYIESLNLKRVMYTPGGRAMSVAMTNCGPLGWVSDAQGYRYIPVDPITGVPWPMIPSIWRTIAQAAAAECQFENFHPQACLINEYLPGSKMSLHQDKDEHNLAAPIVSFSLGIPATFMFGGLKRNDGFQSIELCDGDVVVWGGVDRLRYHGIKKIIADQHDTLGMRRINLTFRQVYQAGESTIS